MDCYTLIRIKAFERNKKIYIEILYYSKYQI